MSSSEVSEQKRKSQPILERVHDPRTIQYITQRIGEQWGYKLSNVQFAEKEGTLKDKSKVANRKPEPLGLYRYALRDLSIEKKHETDDIVGYVETLNRKAWRIDGKNPGVLKEVNSSTIGSVFTFAEHRKKGYANVFLTKVGEILDEQLGEDALTNLYSGVGEFYSRFGYKSFVIPIHFIKSEGVSIDTNDSKYEYLGYEGYDKLIDVQKEYLKQLLLRKGKEIEQNETVVALIPDTDTYTWINDKDAYTTAALNPGYELNSFGAVLKGSNDHILWVHEWNENKLKIAKIFVENGNIENFKKLIQISIKESQDYGLEGVFLWDSSLTEDKSFHDTALEYLKSFAGAVINGSQTSTTIPAIRLHDKTPAEGIKWIDNDYWCWF
ncbi:hypothetical protein BN7_5279 [Wickerhamomyces ciferrii]|uniref:LYC1 C-terminal domain-containing protein n=1 Tax=Wickerhamomyces ciferrii (strain ATCC 14091 / BCRC 22168 / CBS 111 / JCM 3599 / NBRC 0793 / NRRL Y-1031 F-60-10) TaxID=1206466 RepID=K0KW15_WICCF|nr:uncharacterized protein BN7_5279 [Wickerhamomyces ciferrii]CCH45694.1 hypothetical protein BN7_5279 [Wickerhamomyces ciferrii]